MDLELSVELVEDDDGLLDIAPLKKADDYAVIHNHGPEELVLEKIIDLKEEGSDFWIARNGKIPVGYAVGIVCGDDYKSNGIYVSPEYRNKGIGLALKRAQVDFARTLGCKTIFTNIAKENTASIRVQEKAGFKLEFRESGYLASLSL